MVEIMAICNAVIVFILKVVLLITGYDYVIKIYE